MNISPIGLDLIKRFEGLKLAAYPDPGTGAEPYTIGYGHTGGVKPLDTCTLAQAQAWLQSDVRGIVRALADMISVPVTQGQFDACVSLAYNIGVSAFRGSTLLRQLNVSKYQAAADEFPRWNKSGGKVLPGLVDRRAAECALFLGEA